MMDYDFHPLAEQELWETTLYFDRCGANLGDSFEAEVVHAIERIRTHPFVGRVWDPKFRRYRIRRFPYGIVYHPTKDLIHIVAIMHLHRGKDYWAERLKALSK